MLCSKKFKVDILNVDKSLLLTCLDGYYWVPNGNKYTADPNSNYDRIKCGRKVYRIKTEDNIVCEICLLKQENVELRKEIQELKGKSK